MLIKGREIGELKKGDRVVCIDNDGVSGELMRGSTYEVGGSWNDENSFWVIIHDKSRNLGLFRSARFRAAQSTGEE